MADIDIVHKKRTSVWLWVALAIIVLAVLFLLFGMTADPSTVTHAPGGASTPAVALGLTAAPLPTYQPDSSRYPGT